ncbi:tRNA lysidine(34) synthetase TilS [Fervidobacterium pennivorans subsp. shakshaketiis]|uniref:tRNA(Ile)-lysidine synthase n=1 Tax=Fervidobacterium pennivorans (strain DSM 9078 / Ven5) TaxID=771875 RepID=H9UAJ6_FERPD|nr:tRNA lysidine(34) synthetase TilS [Fervidobacterium pennivorans]AFG34539.1 tRNA(Ile)-lysidine synthetase [Fervidobacterium pennivorans DSM 9078]QIV77868.1 tRNA lysidine(34) synthetase TilS [Fervidobacterium pennivorans subsp. keratinolyticus]
MTYLTDFSSREFEKLDLYEKFKRIIDEYASGVNSFLLAVSGGIDSITMLDLFYRLKKERQNLRIGVATFNHKLRPEADEEVEFVRAESERMGFTFYTDSADVRSYSRQNKMSIEEAARNLRYRFLEQVMKEHHYELTATAHNANDLLETMIMRFTKGTGPFGLAGLKIISNNYFRPMLFFTRQEIELYAKNRNLDYVVDMSNYDEHYQRNYIRHSIVPLLKKINHKLENAAISLALSIWEMDEYVERVIEKTEKYILDNRLIFKLHSDPFLQIEQLRRFSLRFFGKPLDREKIERFSKNVIKSKSFKVSFWGELGAEVSHGWVMLGNIKRFEPFKFVIELSDDDEDYTRKLMRGIEVNGYFINLVVRGIIKSDIPKISLIVRNWNEGDRTFEGRKLKEIFNEKKVPTFVRRLIPIAVLNERVVYVPEYYKSKILDEMGLEIVSKGGINFES